MIRYAQLLGLIDDTKPSTIIEVGTFEGKRAHMMAMQALLHCPMVHYTGFDLFEDMTPDVNMVEKNGKGPVHARAAMERLDEIKRIYPGFSYELIKGNTRNTLHGRHFVADFVFIDGGHSVQTIHGDYEALKESKVIVFDDFYSKDIDTARYGCNTLLADIPHYILPLHDKVTTGGIVQMAVRL